jgi:hypothetical protein
MHRQFPIRASRSISSLASCAIILGLSSPASLSAQSSNAQRAAAGTITAADIARRINVIADDSMMGRDTPSPGLEMTARYVAAQFQRFGLKPAGENGAWFQRYRISRRRVDMAGSRVGFLYRGKRQDLSFERDARYALGGVPDKEVVAPAVLIAGPFSSDDAAKLDVKGKAILLVMDYSKPLTQSVQQAVVAVRNSGAVGVVMLSNRDSASFAQRVGTQTQPLLSGVEGLSEPVPIVEVHERALGGMIAGLGLSLPQLRAAPATLMKPLPDLRISFGLRTIVLDSASAPNTVGLLEGSDPRLKHEYVVFSAHMDHIGISRGQTDSINNGADDDGSGTVGVMELAEAFSQRGVRPKRSIIFLTVSGEEKGLYGSSYFTAHPTVPMANIVADLNIDMIGRNWKDTIVAIGKEHSDLGATLNRVAASHPELHMAPIDDRWPEENFYFRSDHYNFARRGVPILFFFNGVHEDYHRPSDSPDKIESEKESRILRLLFYLGQDVANAPARPKWNPDSYAKIVEGGRE